MVILNVHNFIFGVTRIDWLLWEREFLSLVCTLGFVTLHLHAQKATQHTKGKGKTGKA